MGDSLTAEIVTGGVDSAAGVTTEAPTRKRNRTQFSCRHCREKKLKCNRVVPCDQCAKRGLEDSCEYLTKEAQARSTDSSATSRARQIIAENAALRMRVLELERFTHQDSHASSGGSSHSSLVPGKPNGEYEKSETCSGPSVATAGVLVDDNQRHLSNPRWEAILDDVAALTLELENYDEEMDTMACDAINGRQGPLILLGGFPETTVGDLLQDLPSRPVADRLVTKFFQLEEPSWTLIHIPTFLKQYEQFWSAPEQVSITWLALLYTMFTYAAWQSLRSSEPYAFDSQAAAQHAHDAFRTAASRCLVQDDYTVPGKYKVETLILYFGMEYYRRAQEDTAPTSASFLWAGIVRLALHMGYHRDPRHFQHITPFEGEMRRRAWALLVECDTIVSFLFGVPISIPRRFSDTALPRNLRDEDLSEDMTELPVSRSDAESTPVLYQITACRIMSVFADILDAVADRNSPSYTAVLELDAKLTDSESRIPLSLRPKRLMEAVMDPAGLIIQRYWLQIVVHRARCVLHRRWLRAGKRDERVARSRRACINAAVCLLRTQAELDQETQPGGRLFKERWMLTRCIPDFLLGGMILCLELSDLKKASGELDLEVVVPTEEMLRILRASRKIWQTSHKESRDASRAFKIISRMLAISTGSSPCSGSGDERRDSPTERTPESEDNLGCKQPIHDFNNSSAPTPQQPFAGSRPGALSYSFPDLQWAVPSDGTSHAEYSNNTPMDIEWSLFDVHIQNPEADDTKIPWEFLFDPACSRTVQ